jgi:hypothetical protein
MATAPRPRCRPRHEPPVEAPPPGPRKMVTQKRARSRDALKQERMGDPWVGSSGATGKPAPAMVCADGQSNSIPRDRVLKCPRCSRENRVARRQSCPHRPGHRRDASRSISSFGQAAVDQYIPTSPELAPRRLGGGGGGGSGSASHRRRIACRQRRQRRQLRGNGASGSAQTRRRQPPPMPVCRASDPVEAARAPVGPRRAVPAHTFVFSVINLPGISCTCPAGDDGHAALPISPRCQSASRPDRIDCGCRICGLARRQGALSPVT